jgi:hypothetical protein
MKEEKQTKKFLADKIRKDKALQLVQERFIVSQNYTQAYFSKFQRFYSLYRS